MVKRYKGGGRRGSTEPGGHDPEFPAVQRLLAALHEATIIERRVDMALSDLDGITEEGWRQVEELRRTSYAVRRRIAAAAEELGVEVQPLTLEPPDE